MTSEVKRRNTRPRDGPLQNGPPLRNSSRTLPIASNWEEEEKVEAPSFVDGNDRNKSKSFRGRQGGSRRRRSSWATISTSLRAMVDDVVTGLREEEVVVEGEGKKKSSIGNNVAARVSEIVEDSNEFRKLKEEMRATGMSTGAGAMQHIVRLDQ